MSFKKIEASIKHLKDVIDAPSLRQKNKALEKKIEELREVFDRKEQQYIQEINTLNSLYMRSGPKISPAPDQKQILEYVRKEIEGFPDKCSPYTLGLINNTTYELLDRWLKDPIAWPQWFHDQVQTRAEAIAERVKRDELNDRRLASSPTKLLEGKAIWDEDPRKNKEAK